MVEITADAFHRYDFTGCVGCAVIACYGQGYGVTARNGVGEGYYRTRGGCCVSASVVPVVFYNPSGRISGATGIEGYGLIHNRANRRIRERCTGMKRAIPSVIKEDIGIKFSHIAILDDQTRFPVVSRAVFIPVDA